MPQIDPPRLSDEELARINAAAAEFRAAVAEMGAVARQELADALRAFAEIAKAVVDVCRKIVAAFSDGAAKFMATLRSHGVDVITAYSEDGGRITGAVGPPGELGREYDEGIGLWLPVRLPAYRLN